MKKCTSKCNRKDFSWHLHLRLLLWVCSADEKMTNQSPLSDIHQHGQSRQSLKWRPGLCWNRKITGQMVEGMDGSLKWWIDGWMDEREVGWTEHWSEFYSMFSTFPGSRSLHLNQVLLKSRRPELWEFWESWKGKEKSRTEVGQHPEELEIEGEKAQQRIQKSKWWWRCRGSKGTIIRVRGVKFSSGGQAAVVKAFLCWIH